MTNVNPFGSYYRGISMLDTYELALHILEHVGSCYMHSGYCLPSKCPIYIICTNIDKLKWATEILVKADLDGKCESIW